MSKTYYTKDHEWVVVDGDSATMGITDYAQEQLGDLVFVELPEVGKAFSKGDDAIVVESVKAASDVYMPVSGEITQVNDKLADEPALVNGSAESDGWLVRFRVSDPSELTDLLDRDQYEKLLD